MSVKRTLSDTPISTPKMATKAPAPPKVYSATDIFVTADELKGLDKEFDESQAITPAIADKISYKCDKIKTIAPKADAKPGSKLTSLLNIYPVLDGANPTKNIVLTGVVLDVAHSTKTVKFGEYLVDAGIPMPTVDAINARVAKPLGLKVAMFAKDGYYWTRLRIKFETNIMLNEDIGAPIGVFIDNCNKAGLTPMVSIFCTLKYKVSHPQDVPSDGIRDLPMDFGIGPEEYFARGTGVGTSPLPPPPTYGKRERTPVIIHDEASDAAKKNPSVMKMFGNLGV